MLAASGLGDAFGDSAPESPSSIGKTAFSVGDSASAPLGDWAASPTENASLPRPHFHAEDMEVRHEADERLASVLA